MHPKQAKRTLYIKNFIFGVEDSLVSTVGLLSGIAAAGVSRTEILLSGIVLIFVEAFSMGAGSYLSEQSAEDFVHKGKHQSSFNRGAIIMFFSYFFSGFIPLAPYIFFARDTAFVLSILASLIALFLLGTISSKYFKRDSLKHGVRMLVVGGVAILMGVVAGVVVKGLVY